MTQPSPAPIDRAAARRAPGARSVGMLPRELTIATVLWGVAVVLDLAVGLLTGLGNSALIEAQIQQALSASGVLESDLAPGVFDSLRATPAFSSHDFVGVIGVVLVILLVRQMRAGKRNSRLMLAILGGLRIALYGVALFLLFPLVQFDVSGMVLVICAVSVVEVAVVVAACVSMFRKGANTYLDGRVQPPAGGEFLNR